MEESKSIQADAIYFIDCAYSTLRQSERRVADIVIEDIARAAAATGVELAVLARVSESTVLRFCRAVGCLSLSDLQSRLGKAR
ncbi:hypothetical protein G6L85_19540 [Agrobacterium rhizogenes]|nr:hypothetical protein [Rhizobium rhizogenes]NTI63710.1 hypothetical protein [Rhizobium rhizogenes]